LSQTSQASHTQRNTKILILVTFDDLSVSTELVDAREDKQLWGEQYSRKVADIHTVQQEIAAAISGNLRLHLSNEEAVREGPLLR
jgi:hypothetical protein